MSKLSKSESGKLGAEALQRNAALRKEEAKRLYYTNPKCCLDCNNPISYENRSTSTFCSRSCSATYHNSLRRNNEPNPSVHRSRADIRLDKIADIENGLVTVRETLKTYLSEKFGYNCFECKESTWRGKILPLELDHINGDASDNFPNNIRLLCPNCHSITPTWKGRNKGNGRKSRGLTLY